MRKTAKKPKSATKLILFTLLTTTIVLTLSLAKYRTTIAGSSSATVATPIITLSEGTIANLKISPEISNEYTFTVSNYDENGSTSQTSMEYILQITSLSNLPLEFELYACDNGKEEEVTLTRTEQQIILNLI